MAEERTCGNCRFWEHLPDWGKSAGIEIDLGMGRCHWSPVSLDILVANWNWCGQWKERPEPPLNKPEK